MRRVAVVLLAAVASASSAEAAPWPGGQPAPQAESALAPEVATVPEPAPEPAPAPELARESAPESEPAPAPESGVPLPPPALTLSGYLQIDSVAWSQASVDELDPETSEPLNETRTFVRRARLIATARRERWRGLIELDGNSVAGRTARLVAASATLSIAGDDVLAATVGLFKIPFGVEVPEREADRFFLEAPSYARALFPGGYDAGIAVGGAWRFLVYRVAATNGAPVEDAQFVGRDPAAGVDLVGRLGVDVDAGGGVAVRAGVSALVGRGLHPGEAATKDGLVWTDANEDGVVQTTELSAIAGAPATPSEGFDHDALGFDAEVGWSARGRRGALRGEIAIAKNLDRGRWIADPIATDRDLRELGWSLGASQAIAAGVEVGLRHDRYHPDRDAAEAIGVDVVPRHPRFATTSAVLGWRGADARVLVVYDHETNPSGRDAAGAPTTLAADRLTARVQVEL